MVIKVKIDINRSIGWNIDNMKVKFKDGTYTWVKPNTGGKKTHAGLDAPPGWEWKKWRFPIGRAHAVLAHGVRHAEEVNCLLRFTHVADR